MASRRTERWLKWKNFKESKNDFTTVTTIDSVSKYGSLVPFQVRYNENLAFYEEKFFNLSQAYASRKITDKNLWRELVYMVKLCQSWWHPLLFSNGNYFTPNIEARDEDLFVLDKYPYNNQQLVIPLKWKVPSLKRLAIDSIVYEDSVKKLNYWSDMCKFNAFLPRRLIPLIFFYIARRAHCLDIDSPHSRLEMRLMRTTDISIFMNNENTRWCYNHHNQDSFCQGHCLPKIYYTNVL